MIQEQYLAIVIFLNTWQRQTKTYPEWGRIWCDQGKKAWS